MGRGRVAEECQNAETPRKIDWWFGTFFIFPYIGNNHPNWLIFFRGVETTNEKKTQFRDDLWWSSCVWKDSQKNNDMWIWSSFYSWWDWWDLTTPGTWSGCPRNWKPWRWSCPWSLQRLEFSLLTTSTGGICCEVFIIQLMNSPVGFASFSLWRLRKKLQFEATIWGFSFSNHHYPLVN